MVERGDHPVRRGETQLRLGAPGQDRHRLGGVGALELDVQLAASSDQGHHLPQGRDLLSLTRIQACQIGAGLLAEHPGTVGAALQPPVVEYPQLAVGPLHIELDGTDPECDGPRHRLEGVLRRQPAGAAMGNDLHAMAPVLPG
ncbi:hypothetical protein D3C80_1663360 [compost metagenome]